MKRIAYLTTQYREVKSGPGRFTEYLRSLPLRGREIHFFSQQIGQEAGKEHPVPIPAWAQKIPFSSFFRAWWFRKALEKAEARQAFDYILAADYSMAMFLPKSLLRKTLVMVNDDNFLLSHSRRSAKGNLSWRTYLSRKLGYYLERRSVRSGMLAISNSRYTSGLIEEVYNMPSARVKLLYKAVDLSWFRYQERAEGKARKWLFVKNDWKRGGLDLLFHALGKLSYGAEVEFTIAGISAAAQEEVKRLAQENGCKARLVVKGLVNREELGQLLSQADLFLNFSRQEALGVSCLEAMASGVPVLASDAGGLKEVLDDGHAGFMVPNGDTEALLQVLEDLDENPDWLKTKAMHAIQHVEKFSVQHLQRNLESIFPD
jgi:glycosyltransferase involved in cell wall biosynthesis